MIEYILIITIHVNGHLLFRPISDPLSKDQCDVIASNMVVDTGSIYCVDRSTFAVPFNSEKMWEFKNYEKQ